LIPGIPEGLFLWLTMPPLSRASKNLQEVDKGMESKVEEIPVERTRSGKPAFWVGGGAFTNTCRGTWVLTENWEIAKPIYVRTSGPRACEEDQALVILKEGYHIMSFYGSWRDVGCDEVPPSSRRVIAFREDPEKGLVAQVIEESVDWSRVPETIKKNLQSYHCRDLCGYLG